MSKEQGKQEAAPKPAPSILEQYEIDAPTPETPPAAEPSAAQQTPVEEPTLPQPESLPRNPDGTFAKRTSGHTPRLVRMAKDLGFTQEEIDETPGDELRTLVNEATLERLHYQHAQSLERGRQEPLPQASQVQGQTQGPVLQGPVPPQGDDPFAGLNADDYDPNFVKLFRSQNKRIAELERALAGMGHRERVREQLTMAERIDNCFARHEGIFGKGTRDEVPQDSPDFAKRLAVIAAMERMPGSSIEAKFTKAVKAIFGDAEPQKPSPKPNGKPPSDLSRRQEEWRGAGLAVPTSREGTEPKGFDKAVKSVQQYMSDNGAAGEPAIADEFPG